MKGVTRENLKVMDQLIWAEAQKICAKYGVAVKLGRGHFSSDGASGDIKLEFSKIGEDGTTNMAEVASWKASCYLFGLKPEDFGATFISNSSAFSMVALAPRRPKFPLVGVRVKDGARFKFSRTTITDYLRSKGRTQ